MFLVALVWLVVVGWRKKNWPLGWMRGRPWFLEIAGQRGRGIEVLDWGFGFPRVVIPTLGVLV